MKIKNFWKYFTITILLLLGLFCAMMLFLFFVPGSSIFGLTYISYHEDVYSNSYDMGETGLYKSISTINLSSNNLDVKISKAASSAISLKVHNVMFGYTVKKHSKVVISQKVENLGTTLTLSVTEPVGAVVAGNSYVELLVPENIETDLILQNNNADTLFDVSTATIKNLSYKTTSGNFVFNSGKVKGEMELSLGRAKFEIKDGVETNENNVYLKLTSGVFSCPKHDFKTINLVSSTSGRITANKCETLKGKNSKAGGSLNFKDVDFVDVTAGDTNVKIENLNSGTIHLNQSGKIEITNILGDADLYSNLGNITIKSARAYLNCSTETGNISVGKAYGTVNVRSQKGSTSVAFADDAESFNPNIEDVSNPRKLIATTLDGNVTARGVENADVKITGKGSVNIYMKDVIGASRVVGGAGRVYVEIKLDVEKPETWPKYDLTTRSATGSVSVNLSTTLEQGTGGYTDRNHPTEHINGGSAVNTLNINTTSGSLKVRNDLTARF